MYYSIRYMNAIKHSKADGFSLFPMGIALDE